MVNGTFSRVTPMYEYICFRNVWLPMRLSISNLILIIYDVTEIFLIFIYN